ncbi:protein kinase [Catenulispora sp. NF23]|uniref:WD40 repeat domain-containing serine/threonine protein kinase n=1 Tax=Catenulispora pinistramenti TaxID=2705254 RepID=UPI001BA89F28|nr:serine/threonine-protein kinase [Catenulispora pinistramenti]MBS2537918.1 protein kinase [Catenulispora pinistramenti]
MTGGTGYAVGGRYRLDDLIGQGGMGRVWRGYDANLDRIVAIKELTIPEGVAADERAELVARAVREARVAARLRHDGVITVHDVVQDGGVPWIVMELVSGGSLAAEMADRGALPWRRAAEIGTVVADALGHAHAGGIVHRDLKPENVLLAGSRVVIADFGIARVLESATHLTRTGVALGTPHYMAPELLEGLEATAAVDLWSLGAMLYTLVEGRRPFDAPTLTALYTAILMKAPEPAVNAGPLAPLLVRLLDKDPAKRPDAVETAGILRAAAGGSVPVPGEVVRRPVPETMVAAPVPPGLSASGSAPAVDSLFICRPGQRIERAWLIPVTDYAEPSVAVYLQGKNDLHGSWSQATLHVPHAPDRDRRLLQMVPSRGDAMLTLGPGMALGAAALTVDRAQARQVLNLADLVTNTVSPTALGPLPGRIERFTAGTVFRTSGRLGIAVTGPGIAPVARVGGGDWRKLPGGFQPMRLASAADSVVIGWHGNARLPGARAVAWNAESCRTLYTFDDRRVVTGVAVSQSGSLVAVSSPAGISLYRPATGEELTHLPLTGGAQSGQGIVLLDDPTGRPRVTYVHGRNVRLWDMSTRELLAELPLPDEPILAAALVRTEAAQAIVIATPSRVAMMEFPARI